MTKRATSSRYRRVFAALLFSAALSVLLYGLRMLEGQSTRHAYLLWNLFLAWLPLVWAWWLLQRLRTQPLSQPGNIFLTFLWIGFLPNSFYLVSDLIHLEITGEVSLLYDAVMFCSFIFNAYAVGMISVYLMHRELLRRVHGAAHGLIALVLLACSFAIYLGRYLRWNTWDVLINPAGLLFDVSDRIVSPGAYPQAFITTLTFFLLIGSIYAVVYEGVEALRRDS